MNVKDMRMIGGPATVFGEGSSQYSTEGRQAHKLHSKGYGQKDRECNNNSREDVSHSGWSQR